MKADNLEILTLLFPLSNSKHFQEAVVVPQTGVLIHIPFLFSVTAVSSPIPSPLFSANDKNMCLATHLIGIAE